MVLVGGRVVNALAGGHRRVTVSAACGAAASCTAERGGAAGGMHTAGGIGSRPRVLSKDVREWLCTGGGPIQPACEDPSRASHGAAAGQRCVCWGVLSTLTRQLREPHRRSQACVAPHAGQGRAGTHKRVARDEGYWRQHEGRLSAQPTQAVRTLALTGGLSFRLCGCGWPRQCCFETGLSTGQRVRGG